MEFFFLGDVRPQFRSTLKNIHLLAVGRSVDIQNYGINAFLSAFVEDLKWLYCDGITMESLKFCMELYLPFWQTHLPHIH